MSKSAGIMASFIINKPRERSAFSKAALKTFLRKHQKDYADPHRTTEQEMDSIEHEEVRRREEAAARAGIVIEEKNWPSFFPIIHHDIANKIPIHLQRIQYVAFTTLLGLTLCLLWNIIAVTTAWIKGEGILGSIMTTAVSD